MKSLLAVVLLVPCLVPTKAVADDKSQRSLAAAQFQSLADTAKALADTAKASEDRAARKRFAPAALDISDDVTMLAKRVLREVEWKIILSDAESIRKQTKALIAMADDVEEKDERKVLRAAAVQLDDGLANAVKVVQAIPVSKNAESVKLRRFSGVFINDSNADKCDMPMHVTFRVYRGGSEVFATNLVPAGKQIATGLDEGEYMLTLGDTTEVWINTKLVVGKEGWAFRTGCINKP
jgi:hypothetical protein